jgi:hypothetical protein
MSKHLKLKRRFARARQRNHARSPGRAGPGGRVGLPAAGGLPQTFTSGRRELALFATVYLCYDVARWMWARHFSLALAHAHQVIALEHSLHIAVEGTVQRALSAGVPSFVLSNIYLAAQSVVLPAALIWLYHRSRAVYRQLRSTVVITWLIAIPIFALYPVAPPRLAGIGIKDIVSRQALVTLTGRSTMFFNPYAAVPSLHVGLAFAIGIAAATTLRRTWTRALALAWGPLVTLTVVATGNHYIFDTATGLLVAALAFAVTRAVNRSHLKLRRVDPAVAFRAAAGEDLNAGALSSQPTPA